MAKLLNGFYYPFGAPLGMPFADIDDVAAAHCLSLAVPEADGRCRFSESLIFFQTPSVMRVPTFSHPSFHRVKQVIGRFCSWAETASERICLVKQRSSKACSDTLSCIRFIVCSKSMLLPQYVNLLCPKYSGFKLTIFWLPFWILWFLLYFRCACISNLQENCLA